MARKPSGSGGRRRPYGRAPIDTNIHAALPKLVEKPERTIPAFSSTAFEAQFQNGYVWGTGRRKSAVARVRVRPGDGKFLVNNKPLEDYFRLDWDRKMVRSALSATQTGKHLDVLVRVHGGGTTGQAGAIVLGLARALRRATLEYEPILRDHGLLTRDARRVERKKYGQRGARRRFQFSKR